MRINEDVLRYLTVRVDALEEGPSAVMQARARGEDRERRREGYRDIREDGGMPGVDE
jgi:small subunit ribosomal protein S6